MTFCDPQWQASMQVNIHTPTIAKFIFIKYTYILPPPPLPCPILPLCPPHTHPPNHLNNCGSVPCRVSIGYSIVCDLRHGPLTCSNMQGRSDPTISRIITPLLPPPTIFPLSFSFNYMYTQIVCTFVTHNTYSLHTSRVG